MRRRRSSCRDIPSDRMICQPATIKPLMAGMRLSDSQVHIVPRCFRCGYDLRGHAGDPHRCPECGCVVPSIREQHRQAARNVRWLQTSATGSLVGVITMIVVLVFSADDLFAMRSALYRLPLHEFIGPAIVFIIALTVTVLCVLWFRSLCRGRTGWAGVLAVYQLFGLGCCGLIALAFYGGARLVGVLYHPIGA